MSNFRDYEPYKKMAELDEKLSTTNSKLDTLDSKLDTLSNKLDTLNDTLATTNRRLTTLLQQDVTLWRINNNGDVIFCDSFEGLPFNWVITIDGTGEVALTNTDREVYHGNRAVKLTLGTGLDWKVTISKAFAVPQNIEGVGFEYAFIPFSTQANIEITTHMLYYNGNKCISGFVVYIPSTGEVSAFGSTKKTFYPKMSTADYAWNKVKFTINFVNKTFLNVFANDMVVDARTVMLSEADDTHAPELVFMFRIRNFGVSSQSWSVYVDDFILSINEPFVEV